MAIDVDELMNSPPKSPPDCTLDAMSPNNKARAKNGIVGKSACLLMRLLNDCIGDFCFCSQKNINSIINGKTTAIAFDRQDKRNKAKVEKRYFFLSVLR